MQEKNKSIIDRLKLREELDKKTLKQYEDLLYRIFQIMFEVDASVTWERIFRFSSKSNFITISGNASVPKGTQIHSLGKDTKLSQDLEIFPSFTFPWIMLDNDSSAYEIAEAAKDLKIFGSMVGSDSLFDYLRSEEFTYDAMRASLPDYQEAVTVPKSTKTDNNDIDLGELTASQLRNMNLEEDDERH